jgi:predicted small lipoprotein YifL
MLLALAGSLALAGCGVRGNLDAPPDMKNDAADAGPSNPGDKEPKKGFVLDPLLR